MAGDTQITLIGNLTGDPELRFTPSGAAVANFTVASTPRTFDRQSSEWKDGDTMFLNCSIWRQAAENVAETLSKGMRVIVQGRLKSRSYDDREGNRPRSSRWTSKRWARPCVTPLRRSTAPPGKVAAAGRAAAAKVAATSVAAARPAATTGSPVARSRPTVVPPTTRGPAPKAKNRRSDRPIGRQQTRIHMAHSGASRAREACPPRKGAPQWPVLSASR